HHVARREEGRDLVALPAQPFQAHRFLPRISFRAYLLSTGAAGAMIGRIPGEGSMPRHIVCLTFDQDHLSGFIARGQTPPTAISRGEYDVVVIPRLIALLERYGIKATFFTPGHTIDSTPQAVRPCVEAGHELAHHGWTHRLPASLSREEEEEEIVRGNESIKRISGRTARGYRSPAWDLSPHSIELRRKHGIQSGSALMGHDYDCYFARQGDVAELKKPFVRGRTTRLIEMPISWSLDDYPHFEYMRNPNGSIQAGLMNANKVLGKFVHGVRC